MNFVFSLSYTVFKLKALVFAGIAVLCMPLVAQPSVRVTKDEPVQTTRILFILDCSNSMYGQWQSDSKIKIAQTLLLNILDSLEGKQNVEVALRAYGHQKQYPPQDCDDSRLEVPFGKNNHDAIRAKIKALVPKGTTPIAYSLEKCKDDFPDCYRCRNVIILITDGLEECGGDPCAVSEALQKNGVALKPFVIGIGKNFRDDLACIGTYYNAADEVEFSQSLRTVMSQAINNTTAQVNLLDSNNEPTETNSVMSFYDSQNGQLKYNYMHTLNTGGLPDTLLLDPLLTYDIDVHTLPQKQIKNKHLVSGKHTIMATSASQGYLILKTVGKTNFNASPVQMLVKLPGESHTLNVQTLNRKEKYLAGYYNLEILTLPRIYLDSIHITQSSVVNVEIPASGILMLQKQQPGMIGAVFNIQEGEQVWVCNIDTDKQSENITLQPGNYTIVWRSAYANRSLQTKQQDFAIVSGEIIKITLTP